jgi:hypothetical protein
MAWPNIHKAAKANESKMSVYSKWVDTSMPGSIFHMYIVDGAP